MRKWLGCAYRAETVFQKGQVNTASHSHQEEQKETRNKAGRVRYNSQVPHGCECRPDCSLLLKSCRSAPGLQPEECCKSNDVTTVYQRPNRLHVPWNLSLFSCRENDLWPTLPSSLAPISLRAQAYLGPLRKSQTVTS